MKPLTMLRAFLGVRLASTGRVEVQQASSPNDTFLRFASHYCHSKVPQKHHLTAKWRGKLNSGRSIAFLTVFVPMPDDTPKPADDVKLSVEADVTSAKRGTLSFTFRALK